MNVPRNSGIILGLVKDMFRLRTLLIIGAVFLGLCVLAFFQTSVQLVHAYVLNSGSMEPTLLIGDYLLTRPLTAREVPRATIVTMHPPTDENAVWVKRVAAIGGDRVHFDNKTLILNGQPQNEPYAVHTTKYVDSFRDQWPQLPTMQLPNGWGDYIAQHIVDGEIVVPPGKYFVLGDNRDDSLDSRYFGFVDRSALESTPVMIYNSMDRAHGLRVRWDRLFRKL